MHYANLDHKLFRCTAELISEIKLQFESNVVTLPYDSIVTGKKINIAYQPFNDTVWSGDIDAVNYFTTYHKIGRIIENTDSILGPADFNKLRNTPSFFREKPIYYGIRYASTKDAILYSIQSYDDDGSVIYLFNDSYIKEIDKKTDNSGLKSSDFVSTDLESFSKTSPFINYKKGNYVYECLPLEYEFKTANVGFWQIHLYPEVWYYKNDLKDFSMYMDIALEKKNEIKP